MNRVTGDTGCMPAGRFAPSPTGDLHLGNLRTALVAWLFAKHSGREFLIRIEDLDTGRSRPEFERQQLADLAALGVTSDGPVLRQSERLKLYEAAITRLTEAGLTYECFCTRREITEAPSAPHAPPGAYPGTCRDLTAGERAARHSKRPAALRLRADVVSWTVEDLLHGEVTGDVDDLVVRRADGMHAYNLAVVIDDAAQDIDQVVRGDDLLASAPRQAYLASLLGLPAVTYAHIPLALNVDGKRLAKRDGAVTLRDLSVERARELIADSLNLPHGSAHELLARFDPLRLPREPWTLDPRAF
jgi:glutamyl-tRNA synthetase